MKLNWALSEGKLTDLGTLALGALGASLIAYTLLISESFWLGSLSFIMGICCLGFAAIANNAASLGLRPFGASLIAYTLLISESFWLGSLSFIMGICCLGFAAIANNAASLGLRPFGEDFFLGDRQKKPTERSTPRR